ncbi:sodium:calcium antiporter [Virgibacillus kekensis]|uniref:Sodium:calcium antiporter n=1 Tax=Virgibacillus kekensis TaxID=202261 RepID=A0ABV9DMD9_9BACI
MLLTSTIIFILSAVVSVFAAIRLATYADIISKKTKAGGLVAGTVLLAVATSLPELTATSSAALIGSADIAMGSGIGSITFNIFVLFLFDIYFRKKRLFLNVSGNHLYTGLLGIILCLIVMGSLYFDISASILTIGLPSIALGGAYLIGLGLISTKHQNELKNEEPEPEQQPKKDISVKSAVRRFILHSITVFIAGSALAISGDSIVQNSGVSASAMGSLLIAATTSLPDAVGVLVALRMANANLAIGTILGSNAFNISIITVADIFYLKGSIWADASNEHISTAGTALLLSLVVITILERKQAKNTLTYLTPSLIVIAGYLIQLSLLLT